MEDTQTFLTTIRHQFEWALAKKKTFSTNILPSRWFTESDLCAAILILVTLKYLKKHIHIIIGPGHVNCRFPTCNCSWCIYQFWYQHVFPLVRLTVGPMKNEETQPMFSLSSALCLFCFVFLFCFLFFSELLATLVKKRKILETIPDHLPRPTIPAHLSKSVDIDLYNLIGK